MCVKMEKIVMISDDYHDIGGLLLLTILLLTVKIGRYQLFQKKIRWLIGKNS